MPCCNHSAATRPVYTDGRVAKTKLQRLKAFVACRDLDRLYKCSVRSLFKTA